MAPSRDLPATGSDMFHALGDPVRWSIVMQLAAVDELPCATLEGTLPVSKPTISYHVKILSRAGLVSVRRQGRNLFYTLRRDVLRRIVDDISTIAPAPDPAGGDDPPGHRPPPARRPAEGVLVTW